MVIVIRSPRRRCRSKYSTTNHRQFQSETLEKRGVQCIFEFVSGERWTKERHHRSCRILNNTKSALVAQGFGTEDNSAAERPTFRHTGVKVGHGDVDQPLWGQSLVDSARMADTCGGTACGRRNHAPIIITAHRDRLMTPANHLFVEVANAIRIGNCQVHPLNGAECYFLVTHLANLPCRLSVIVNADLSQEQNDNQNRQLSPSLT